MSDLFLFEINVRSVLLFNAIALELNFSFFHLQRLELVVNNS